VTRRRPNAGDSHGATGGHCAVRRFSSHATLWILLCLGAFAGMAASAGAAADDDVDRRDGAESRRVDDSADAKGDQRAERWRVEREHWYILRLAGVDCGWMRTASSTDGANQRTESEMSMSLDRGGESVRVSTETVFVETHRGEPVTLRTLQRMGQDPVETLYDFRVASRRGESDGKQVRRTVRQAGGERVDHEALPEGVWFPPAAADRYFRSRSDAGATEIVYNTVDGQSGLQVATVRSIRDGREEVEFDGRTIPATRWRVTTTSAPVESIALFSEDGVLLRSRVNLGFGELETRLSSADEVAALRPGRLPDVILSTMVRPDRPIDDVMRTRRVRMRVAMPPGTTLPDLPQVGAQRVTRSDERSAILEIDRRNPLPATPEDVADDRFREASATIDSDDPLIRTLLQRAVRGVGEASSLERAEACRAFVARFVRDKGMEVAFATASEVARRREGDCSEHAVLLAALLRADGIPSRIASGLIYVDEFAGARGVFGWHMWTQALLEVEVAGERSWRWIDLDATLRRPNHAAYILTGASAMTHGPSDPAMTAMLPLLGRMSVDVLEVEREARSSGSAPARSPRRRRSNDRRRRATPSRCLIGA